MTTTLTPMVHVPDVRAAAGWYQRIGFTVLATHPDEGELDWALLALGEGRLMFSEGGKRVEAWRREVDLYVHIGDVPGVAARVRSIAEVVEDVHVTHYGMREFIVRDLNGFWITFGEPVTPG